MNIEDYIRAFCDGYMCGIKGELIYGGKESEKWLDIAKEFAIARAEQQIDGLNLKEDQKENIKRNNKELAEAAITGMKVRLKESGRLVE